MDTSVSVTGAWNWISVAAGCCSLIAGKLSAEELDLRRF